MSSAMLLILSADPGGDEGLSPAPFDRPSWPPARRLGRVLVVDDDPYVRIVIARLLEEEGYEVESVPDGISALQAAREAAAAFDLVITDVRMPMIDGWELGRRLRQEHPALPVLYISGYSLADRPPAGESFLPKPFEAADLLRRVRGLLGET